MRYRRPSPIQSSGNGIGFFGLLCLVLIVLKLTGFIDWSWWAVTAPLWGGFALFMVGILLFFVFGNFIIVASFCVNKWKERRRPR